MTTRNLKIYAPLQEFTWNGNELKLKEELWIQKLEQPPNLQGLEKSLSEYEYRDLSYLSHWLVFDWYETDKLSPAEILNIVLIALWLVKPTKTYAAFRFELGSGEPSKFNKMIRLLDRFQWVQGGVHDNFDDNNMRSAANYYQLLEKFCHNRGRLNDALVMTLDGCCAYKWQTAIICHAAAIEALLTYSTEPGITKRLANCYACIVETEMAKRHVAYRDFMELYSVRSDIMHGRMYKINKEERLVKLVQLQNALRKLWGTIISSPQLVEVLEDVDEKRKTYFMNLTSSYTPTS